MSDSDTRIKDLPLASTVANDDYIAIDGVANDTRRYKVKDITDSVDAVAGDVTTINNKIGSTSLPTTAQTLTGAISEVVDESGTAVATSMNGSTYVVTVQLKNAAGTVVSSGTVDLPFENTITNGSYSNETLTLTKMGGSTVSIDLSSLSGKAEIMTESEWDDLPDSKLTDGKVYALSGVSPSTQDNPLWQKLGFAALDTTADDCSGAINELNTGLTTLNSNLTDLIKFKDYSCSYSVTANGSTAITASDLNVSTPSGYTPLGFYLIATGNANVIARNIYSRSTGSNTMVQVKNTSSSALSNLTLEISIIYIKSIFVGS